MDAASSGIYTYNATIQGCFLTVKLNKKSPRERAFA